MKAILLVMSVLLAVACSTGPEYRDYQLEMVKVLPLSIAQVIDRGDFEEQIVLYPFEPAEDRFYVVESPEYLDSLFYMIEYQSATTPRLDTLFPDNGILVLLDLYICWEEDLLGYQISHSADTLKVLLEIRQWFVDIAMPGLHPHLIVIGVVGR